MKKILLIFIVSLMAFLGCEKSIEKKQALYSAWCKLHYRTDITFTEWDLLYHDDMLPGMAEKRAADNAAAASAMSATAMGMAAGRAK